MPDEVFASDSEEPFDWYRLVQGPVLRQGDLLEGYRIPLAYPSVPDADAATVRVAFHEYDAVVVLTPSCDLAHKKVHVVSIAPCYDLDAFLEDNDELSTRKNREKLRRGLITGYHVVSQCELAAAPSAVRVVDFRGVQSAPFDALSAFAASKGSRHRLLSPYREALGQAYARFVMRIGYPVEVPQL